MNPIEKIEERREKVLNEMRNIRSMERGTINEYFVPVKHKGKNEPVMKGPYFTISRRGEKKTEGYHISGNELERAKKDIGAQKRFRELCEEYELLTEQLGKLERELGDDSPKKKLSRPKSKKTRK